MNGNVRKGLKKMMRNVGFSSCSSKVTINLEEKWFTNTCLVREALSKDKRKSNF